MSALTRRAGVGAVASFVLVWGSAACGGDDGAATTPATDGGTDSAAHVDAGGASDASGDGRGPCAPGKTPCGGGCVDVSTDGNNCGACGNVCTIDAPSTVACALGRCVATLATITGALGGTFVDASYVYTFNTISHTAVKVPAGGGTPVTMFDGKATGALVAIDVASLYWWDSQIWFAALDGSGAPRVLSTKVGSPIGTTVDANGLYFGSGSQLEMLDLRGGDPIVLATQGPGATIGGVASDATSFYFTDSSGNVSSVPRAGGTPTKLAFNQTAPTEIAVSATDVYWHAVDSSTSQGALWSVPITGGAWTKQKVSVSSLRIDGASIYGTTDSGLVKIPLGGGPTTILSASKTAVPGAFDATSVYWIENANNGVGRVMKLWPK